MHCVVVQLVLSMHCVVVQLMLSMHFVVVQLVLSMHFVVVQLVLSMHCVVVQLVLSDLGGIWKGSDMMWSTFSHTFLESLTKFTKSFCKRAHICDQELNLGPNKF